MINYIKHYQPCLMTLHDTCCNTLHDVNEWLLMFWAFRLREHARRFGEIECYQEGTLAVGSNMYMLSSFLDSGFYNEDNLAMDNKNVTVFLL